MVKIFGFTLLRNGIKYDYSFKECLNSLAPVCESIYVAVGKSEDGTEVAVAEIPKVHSIPTVWDDSLREGGLILSQQTNIALDELRKDHGTDNEAWGFYLQCDEVIHEDDYALIKEDFQKAQDQGCDAISFRYLHFWMTHHHIAINKKWYPQEIRAVKVNSDCESWGDAQSFRNVNKVYQSEARIYHYGHVREEDKYKEKKADILKLYHSDSKLPKYKKREKRFDDLTETLVYWGKHPEVMKERILRMGDVWQLETVESAWIVGASEDYSEVFKRKIAAKEVHWVKNLSDVPRKERDRAVIINHNFINKFTRPSKVPTKMRSKLALEWSPEFYLVLKLSEKGIGFKG
ncbi:MAG: hypothetical protein EP326_03400 [Deltaproteobacteria bacterium]|nr:MAG: hypothetical protein EP326_03400 [Deltaproteobacteria bacterium]TNF28524.1 MAG: hypothetical protein EP319_08805 [Deltaproteobacteria bacterium]